MTIKIRTWRTTIGAEELGDRNVVCVLPRDWFKVMKVVREADDARDSMRVPYSMIDAIDALRKRL